jgi:hypothetical protein
MKTLRALRLEAFITDYLFRIPKTCYRPVTRRITAQNLDPL